MAARTHFVPSRLVCLAVCLLVGQTPLLASCGADLATAEASDCSPPSPDVADRMRASFAKWQRQNPRAGPTRVGIRKAQLDRALRGCEPAAPDAGAPRPSVSGRDGDRDGDRDRDRDRQEALYCQCGSAAAFLGVGVEHVRQKTGLDLHTATMLDFANDTRSPEVEDATWERWECTGPDRAPACNGTARGWHLDLEAGVLGCPDLSNHQHWDHKCNGQATGKLYSRGAGGKGPWASMLPMQGKAHHSASLQLLPSGSLALAWFSGEENADAAITFSVLALARAGGAWGSWARPRVVSARRKESCQNPVLHYDAASSALILLHTCQAQGKGQATSSIYRLESRDEGATWSKAAAVKFQKPGVFIRHRIVPHATGKGPWMLPIYYTPTGLRTINQHYEELAYSNDRGKSWTAFTPMSKPGNMVAQQSMVRLPGGVLAAFHRGRRSDWVYRSYSRSLKGREWSRPVPTQLPNNNGGIQVAVLASGALVMVFNNAQGIRRLPLDIALSYNDGLTWPHVRSLELSYPTEYKVPLPNRVKGEMSYPTVVQAGDGLIHVAYSWRRAAIKHVVVSEDWIREGGTDGFFKGDPHGVPKMPKPMCKQKRCM